ncbi:twin-arginine translocation signal domain-containing protein [Arenibaculum pallidiluteum]|uniref:twin-arginine translocation signal domain-containing protein n=1 Tax=Arenibaculum pallidiluteum TaxID=2812559 RepID=UPI001A957E57|nr:twin-arginine translocation signal domain-containing protein [Arenibaculum pallidiluteum]
MSRDDTKPGLERRQFLKTVGLASAGAAAIAATGTEAEARETPQEQVKPRYQSSEHVKRYYALNRL